MSEGVDETESEGARKSVMSTDEPEDQTVPRSNAQDVQLWKKVLQH